MYRKEKIVSLLKDLVSNYLPRLSLGNSLVSITRIEISPDLKFAKIFVSIYTSTSLSSSPSLRVKDSTSPEDKKVLNILRKKSQEIKKYVGSKTKMKFLPQLEFVLDKGEKNRQRIEELLNK